jgi:coenzyme F420-reducing hydrogenase gamma subunit
MVISSKHKGNLKKPRGNKNNKRLSVGFFSFTCDEGCMITFIEILNKKFFDWNPLLDIKYCRQLKRNNVIKNIDVAFVEGAISTFKEEKKLKEIRKNSKVLVAMGSCAVSGFPSNQRNFFDEERKKEIDFLLKKFKHREKVSALKEIVKVDFEVPGCPMMENKFMEVMEKQFKDFGIRD